MRLKIQVRSISKLTPSLLHVLAVGTLFLTGTTITFRGFTGETKREIYTNYLGNTSDKYVRLTFRGFRHRKENAGG